MLRLPLVERRRRAADLEPSTLLSLTIYLEVGPGPFLGPRPLPTVRLHKLPSFSPAQERPTGGP